MENLFQALDTRDLNIKEIKLNDLTVKSKIEENGVLGQKLLVDASLAKGSKQ
jgi:hypothetical protein